MTKNVNVRMGFDLAECIEARTQELELPTASDYVRALIRADLLKRSESVKAASLHRLNTAEKNRFDDWLAESCKSGEMALIQCRFETLQKWETLLEEVA